jgi:hypothetical protein
MSGSGSTVDMGLASSTYTTSGASLWDVLLSLTIFCSCSISESSAFSSPVSSSSSLELGI